MTTPKQIAARIEQLAKEPADTFLDLAKALRQLHDLAMDLKKTGKPNDLFESTLAKAKIGLRKAHYLVEIDRTFSPLKIPKKLLLKLGWTKLALLSRHVTPDNWQSLLGFAEDVNVYELKAELQGDVLPSHVVTLRFTEEQFDTFASNLLINGAYLVGAGGLANKEVALMRVFRLLKKARDAGIW